MLPPGEIIGRVRNLPGPGPRPLAAGGASLITGDLAPLLRLPQGAGPTFDLRNDPRPDGAPRDRTRLRPALTNRARIRIRAAALPPAPVIRAVFHHCGGCATIGNRRSWRRRTLI